jgi:hypothetical protein
MDQMKDSALCSKVTEAYQSTQKMCALPSSKHVDGKIKMKRYGDESKPK